ncbi:uncharacterized protein LOC142739033 [Rhinoderma darwinii]|uniref:uncharacterized protein LOC142739033 n=1 Tax=Rhinoderma darwinii TaxID=43563 RepID=UPI003F681D61
MRTLFIYGYVLGLTLASPITRFQEFKEGLKRIDNTKNNGDHEEETAIKQMQPHSVQTPKIDHTMQPSLNYIVTGMKAKRDESRVKKQTSNPEINKSPRIKYQRRRDLSHLTQNLQKRRTSGKKRRPKKIIESHNVCNTSRKIMVNDKFKHKLEKGSIIKHLQKRSIDYEDTLNDPYHSPDISYDWDQQENFHEEDDDSQELKETASSTKNIDFTSNIVNENSDPTDSSESDHISSNESSNLRGSSESSSPTGPNESNTSSNESSYNIESEESTSDVSNKATVLHESSDFLESSEPNVQNSVFTTAGSETTDGLSEYRLLSESGCQENSSRSSEHNESSNSSDSGSKESSNSSDSSSNETSNSMESNTSSHSTESTINSDSNTENSSQYIEGTVIIDDIEENEIHS